MEIAPHWKGESEKNLLILFLKNNVIYLLEINREKFRGEGDRGEKSETPTALLDHL